MRRHTLVALNSKFEVDAGYRLIKGIREGVAGNVISAMRRHSGEQCAIMKMNSYVKKRCLKEIKLLRHFRGHRNIICLYDMDINLQPTGNFDHVYLYQELMEVSLQAIIQSGQSLSDAHFQSFIYQILCGVKYIHSANVLHCGIKPQSLLVNVNCDLKIFDFAEARPYILGTGVNRAWDLASDYPHAVQWYFPPEFMLRSTTYSTPVDIWSVGCILAEFLGGNPIFRCRDSNDWLHRVLRYAGTPPEDTLSRIASPHAQDYIRSLPVTAPTPFSKIFPRANPLATDLLGQMLELDPTKRISCDEALNHPYLGDLHDTEDEYICDSVIDFSFQNEMEGDAEGTKRLIIEEVNSFRAFVRT